MKNHEPGGDSNKPWKEYACRRIQETSALMWRYFAVAAL